MREIECCVIYFVDDEYIALSWQDDTIKELEKSTTFIEVLGKLGQKGWEPVTSSSIITGIVILKRITREHVRRGNL